MLVSDDASTLSWLRQALSPLDLSLMECAAKDPMTRLAEARIDLVVVDGGRAPTCLMRMIENTACDGPGVSIMFVVDASEVSRQRLPSRFSCDFFVKGGTLEEFTIRVRSLVWPGEEVGEEEPVRVGDLTVNIATRQAYRGPELLDLTGREYELLTFLVTHPGRVYSREVLLSRVWGTGHHGTSRMVDVQIRRVRSKLGTELSDLLETVRGIGYLWRSQ
jgi:DNA-binding response OmpR family regulator